jgi:PAS domain-containing protein
MNAKIAAIRPFVLPGQLQEQAEALRRSEACLVAAQRLTRTGSFGWNVSRGEIFLSGEMYRSFEFDPASAFSIELILHRTHPEDRAMVQQVIDEATREGKNYDLEHRLQMPDGSIKYVRVAGRLSKGD